jgi:hypothetical protein
MTFAAFEKSILSSDLRRVALHWNEARGPKALPSWSDIKPPAIARQLTLVWSYIYDPIAGDFVGRLGGESVTRMIGRNLKGVRMAELGPVLNYERLFGWANRVMTEPALLRARGIVFHQRDRHGLGERIIMPLANDGISGDGVIGATDYRLEGIIPSEASKIEETEDWFPL